MGVYQCEIGETNLQTCRKEMERLRELLRNEKRCEALVTLGIKNFKAWDEKLDYYEKQEPFKLEIDLTNTGSPERAEVVSKSLAILREALLDEALFEELLQLCAPHEFCLSWAPEVLGDSRVENDVMVCNHTSDGCMPNSDWTIKRVNGKVQMVYTS